eukprot:TRINITY_DN15137_c0_g2_i2.p1 TRINITY_DN15137_c0_g2~~TRINITY_DN15137_c0_g2_i2.p1  ORF type:complete len:872 (+),score=153.45 TRINITY_DN15137_c0_g2_i2:167-2782(+)
MTPHETSALPGGPRARVARVSSLDPKPDPHMPLNPRGLGGARDEIDQDGSSFQMFCDALDECAAPAAETASKGDLFRDTQAQAIHHTGYNQWLNDRLSLPRAADGLAFEEYALLLDKMLVVAAADSELQQAAERALHILHSAPTSPSGDLSHETLVKPLLVGCRRFELPEAAALAVKGISGLGQLQSLRQITGCHPELLERLCAGCCDLIGHYITQPKLHPECTNQAVGAAMELVAVGIRGKALLRTMDCARQAHAAASRKHQIELLRSVCFRLLLIAMPVPARDSGPQRDAIDPDVAELIQVLSESVIQHQMVSAMAKSASAMAKSTGSAPPREHGAALDLQLLSTAIQQCQHRQQLNRSHLQLVIHHLSEPLQLDTSGQVEFMARLWSTMRDALGQAVGTSMALVWSNALRSRKSCTDVKSSILRQLTRLSASKEHLIELVLNLDCAEECWAMPWRSLVTAAGECIATQESEDPAGLKSQGIGLLSAALRTVLELHRCSVGSGDQEAMVSHYGRKLELTGAVEMFNSMLPDTAVKKLISNGFLLDQPESVAGWIHGSALLSPTQVGSYLGGTSKFNREVLQCFMQLQGLAEMSLLQALRSVFCGKRVAIFGLFKRRLSSILDAFCQRFVSCNPHVFPSVQAALAYAQALVDVDMCHHRDGNLLSPESIQEHLPSMPNKELDLALSQDAQVVLTDSVATDRCFSRKQLVNPSADQPQRWHRTASRDILDLCIWRQLTPVLRRVIPTALGAKATPDKLCMECLELAAVANRCQVLLQSEESLDVETLLLPALQEREVPIRGLAIDTKALVDQIARCERIDFAGMVTEGHASAVAATGNSNGKPKKVTRSNDRNHSSRSRRRRCRRNNRVDS